MLGDFDKYFSIVIADNADLIRTCHQLRKLSENSDTHSNHQTNGQDHSSITQQNNSFEGASLHRLLQYNPTKQYVAAVSLIAGAKLRGNAKLPIEQQAKELFFNTIDYDHLDINNIAEASRFVILPGFRPKLALLGLIRAILQICLDNNIYYIYVAIEPRIARILERISIKLTPISPIINYHGECQCYFAFIQEIIESVQNNNLEVWKVLTNNGQLVCDYQILTKTKSNEIDDHRYTFI